MLLHTQVSLIKISPEVSLRLLGLSQVLLLLPYDDFIINKIGIFNKVNAI